MIPELVDNGSRFTFQRAVWLLQQLQADAVPVGQQGPPSREAVRFRPVLGLEFPATEVAGIREVDGQGGPRFEVETNFFGLYGTPSPLPTSYTEDLIEEERDGGISRGFFDLFNHRLISLFFRAMGKYRFASQFGWDGTDPIARRLQLLCGVAAESMPGRAGLSPVRMLAFASAMRRGSLSAENLQAVLRDYFADLDVALQQCVPRWIPIPTAQQSHLGRAPCRLGVDSVLGTSVCDRANTFRVTLGPLPFARFLEFLPGAPRMNELRELLDLLNRGQLDYEVELILDPQEEPELRLGSPTARLSWTSWLGQPDATGGQGATVRFLFQEWFHE